MKLMGVLALTSNIYIKKKKVGKIDCVGDRINTCISGLKERIVFGYAREGGCKSYLVSGAAGQRQIRP